MKLQKPKPTPADHYEPSFSRYTAVNVTRKCLIDGCDHQRRGIAYYCNTHKKKVDYYNHPLACAVANYDLQQYRDEVKALLDLNPNHVGFKFVERFFRARWKAATDPTTRELVELPDIWTMIYLGRTTQEIIEIMGGLTLMRNRDELERIILTEQHFKTVLIQKLIQNLSYKRLGLQQPVKSQVLRFKRLAADIWDGLGLFLTNLSRHCDRRADALLQNRMDQAKPFVILGPDEIKKKGQDTGERRNQD